MIIRLLWNLMKSLFSTSHSPEHPCWTHWVLKPRGLLVSNVQKQALWLWLNPKIHFVTSVEAVHVQWLLYQSIFICKVLRDLPGQLGFYLIFSMHYMSELIFSLSLSLNNGCEHHGWQCIFVTSVLH